MTGFRKFLQEVQKIFKGFSKTFVRIFKNLENYFDGSHIFPSFSGKFPNTVGIKNGRIADTAGQRLAKLKLWL